MRRTATALLIVSLTLVMGTGIAHASCLQPPPIEESFAEAELVFVGTVIAISNRDRNAVMAVQEIWKGPALAAEVTVTGAGDPDPNLFTSVDRVFRLGATYLVFPESSALPMRDNACSPTRELSAELEVLRPATVVTPLPPGTVTPDVDPRSTEDPFTDPSGQTDSSGSGIAGLAIAAGVAAVLLAGATTLAFLRARTKKQWSEGFSATDKRV